MPSLAALLVRHLGDAARAPAPDDALGDALGAGLDDELEAVLARAIADARAAWPGVEVAPDVFVAYLAARLDPAGDLLATLRALCLPDLWLACAITRADPAALRAFEAHALRDVDAAIAHLDGGTALADDVRHAVRARVLGTGPGVGDGKLADYRGRGDLRGWLRVVAVREALQLLRARRRETPLDVESTLADRLGATGAVDTLTADERRAYRDAFAAALASLTPRERNLLRQQYLYGMTIDELATLFGVHRATVARWVARVRELVLRRTRRHVGDALALAGPELDSVMGRIADHLDVSLRQTLSLE